MARLKNIWNSKDVTFQTKIKLFKALILSTLLYGCESWTLTAETTKKLQSFELRCYRRMLGISWKEHRTNDYVRTLVRALAGPQEPLLTIAKRRKLAWFGHVTRHCGIPKTVLQGTLEGGRKRGRQSKTWLDNVKEWTRMDSPNLIRTAEDRPAWRDLTRKSSYMSPRRSSDHGTSE